MFMSLEENKKLVRRFLEAYNNRNLDSLDDFVSQDFIDHTPNHQQGLESLKQLFNLAFKAFPDWHETIEEIIAEGDKVWLRLTYTGTHTGEWLGMAPTGKKITTTAFDIFRIVDGKIVEGRFATDELSFLLPLGVIDYTEKGKKLFGK